MHTTFRRTTLIRLLAKIDQNAQYVNKVQTRDPLFLDVGIMLMGLRVVCHCELAALDVSDQFYYSHVHHGTGSVFDFLVFTLVTTFCCFSYPAIFPCRISARSYVHSDIVNGWRTAEF
ncbi:hypothetical protein BDR06DRAFT_951407 [Suillus hirtellus]|nr:hypothetical protein BDR06DRAFT_951407 [Suillus hirtellus]